MPASPPPQPHDLVRDLLRPENFPGRTRRVTLASTHISHVFLTDTEAWKVKRPVDFGFLDFTTLEKRRRFCREEVRINRDLAPGVYRGVAPVRLDARGHSLRRGGRVVDYAVRMKRLPDRARAREMLEAGRLAWGHLAALAARLAAWYPGRRRTPRFGTAAAIRVNVRENFEQVAPFVGRFVAPERFASVRRWQEEFLRTHAGALRARVRAGRIREGHGDLRLEHVYFLPSGPAAIDGIEFNERFRCGDVASDVAFFAMELVQRGRHDLASWFLGRFALETGDFDLLTVLDFYISYRAWVRAKVACFVADDPSTPPDKALRKSEEASAGFALAEACTRPPWETPRVIVVAGQVASGKSTVAEAVARALGYPVVSSDATRKTLAGLGLRDRGGPGLYTKAFSRRTFRELFRRARVVLRSGRGVILDATFGARALRARARKLAGKLPFLLVEAWCDDATTRRRLRKRARGASVSDAREAEWRLLKGRFEPIGEFPPGQHVRVDTRLRVEAWVPEVLKALGR
ncbi:MAG: AAA family ATPase [Planctomycetes bacterium]|nr:AAA family ATPase [Planctomycetota bacterium]